MSFLKYFFMKKQPPTISANSSLCPKESNYSSVSVGEIALKCKDNTAKLNFDPNLHFIIRENDLERALKKDNYQFIDMALKKAALYAGRAIVLTEPKTYYSTSGVVPSSARDFWSDSNVSNRLRELYKQLGQTPSFSDVFCFFPEKVINENEEWEGDGEWMTAEPVTFFDFSSLYKNRLGIEMSLSDPTINSHIFENLNCTKDEISVINVWLPQIKNIPLDVLLKIREDEADSFSRFQYALRKLITAFGELDTETKAKELFQYVDYEVRLFENRMNQIRKSRLLRACETVIGASVMGLSFALPTDIAKIVLTTIGVYNAKEFISYLFRGHEQVNNQKLSDFYVPWLCAKKGNNESK